MEANIKQLERVIKDHESVIHTSYHYEVSERVAAILGHYKHDAAKAILDRKNMTEDALVYFRSVVMLCESIGLAGTHAEKNARLRGLVELLNTVIDKLRHEQTEGLLSNWPDYGFGGRSDYPYRDILQQYRQLQAENEQMKKTLAEQNGPFRSPEP